MASLAAAGIVYLLSVREFFATKRFPRRVVIMGLVLAAVWQIEFLRLPAGPDDDIHRYVWDGRLQRLGYNPYLVIPSDPAVAALPISSGSGAFLSHSHCDPGIHLCVESRICDVRARDYFGAALSSAQ